MASYARIALIRIAVDVILRLLSSDVAVQCSPTSTAVALFCSSPSRRSRCRGAFENSLLRCVDHAMVVAVYVCAMIFSSCESASRACLAPHVVFYTLLDGKRSLVLLSSFSLLVCLF